MTLAELVEAYLDAHAVGREARTIRTLRERLRYAIEPFGTVKLRDLQARPRDIATWTRTLPPGSRYGIVQALRQALDAAVRWQLMTDNPAKRAGANREPHREEVAPLELDELARLAVELGPYGPLAVFAAETGLRPSEWIALERRDIDRDARVIRVERTFADRRTKSYGRWAAPRRRVPLSARALAALDARSARLDTPLVFPSPTGRHIDLCNFRAREWRPALEAAGIPSR